MTAVDGKGRCAGDEGDITHFLHALKKNMLSV